MNTEHFEDTLHPVIKSVEEQIARYNADVKKGKREYKQQDKNKMLFSLNAIRNEENEPSVFETLKSYYRISRNLGLSFVLMDLKNKGVKIIIEDRMRRFETSLEAYWFIKNYEEGDIYTSPYGELV
ncbi:hypothetical protein KEI82_002552 [Staphylococcus pseudintermedius]|uniref:hypothetical protein n=1 Tax=Staphylococcus pseudintermedius TaxID=283734 RepID=UPI0018F5D685|nr:hypothetical protein [Staphylococcus pseudintermedius]EGQ3068519.1 hypothetical protein [Staphylococcus pseudintermedius]EGQ3151794.1 hypothetical protein [Staphylococcus pseudintermedius]EGQ3871485.1 hypothetical protein [Staphylococcus pseudintermedius]EHL7209685.1 hypothetical protein [Staphylococcus pseudintermedius]EHT6215647.1 hypothetical protein [Staphylococcus pseudintermedius]